MKKDRLFEITVYLLKNGRTQASKLAEQFGVVTKTIQRDMDALGLAGIPVISVPGGAGGYDLSEHFKLDRAFIEENDYAYLRALIRDFRASRKKGPVSSESLEEEASSEVPMKEAEEFPFVFGDREQLLLLEKAIREKLIVRFSYRSPDGILQRLSVEPVAVHYRDAEWYLFAWLASKEDYRSYRITRMQDVSLTDRHFKRTHDSAGRITEKPEKRSRRKPLSVLVRCKAAVRSRAEEYLQGTVAGAFENGDVLLRVSVVEDEKFWLGAFLYFEDSIEIISPERVRVRVREAAERIAAVYGKG